MALIPRGQIEELTHYLDVAPGRKVEVRTFVPRQEKKRAGKAPPAVIFDGGLAWMGAGTMGVISTLFNREYAIQVAQQGLPCVMVLSPGRHIQHTMFVEVCICLLWPLAFLGQVPQTIFLLTLLFFLASQARDLGYVAVIYLLSGRGWVGCVALYVMMRVVQLTRGEAKLGGPRDSARGDLPAVITWAQGHQDKLTSNGKFVLMGYSSGAHAAALYLVSEVEKPYFEAAIFIAGIYRVAAPQPWYTPYGACATYARFFLRRAYGASRDEVLCPVTLAKKGGKLSTGRVMIVNSEKEFRGLPIEGPLFTRPAEDFCTALREARGARVDRLVCGAHHWAIVGKIGDVLGPLAASFQ